MSVSRQCVIDTTIDSKGESFRKQVTNEMFFRCPVPTRQKFKAILVREPHERETSAKCFVRLPEY